MKYIYYRLQMEQAKRLRKMVVNITEKISCTVIEPLFQNLT